MSLQIKDLTKRYGKHTACDGLSLSLEESSTAVLLGPNGAGKSTLIKSIIGFLRYDGMITVDGLDNRSSEGKRLLGYVAEIPALYPNLTVSEHLEFVARAYRLTDYRDYAEELLDRFELTDKKKKFGDELSKGMSQKLNLCLGLLPRPKYLLLDEPMIGLDPHAIKELRDIIDEHRERGGGALICTHMIDSVDMLWDKALIMGGGKLLASATKDSLKEDGTSLESLFFSLTEAKAEA